MSGVWRKHWREMERKCIVIVAENCLHLRCAFYELRPEAETQKALAQESYEALFDNLNANYIDLLLAQFEEDD